eukprot:m.330212 g.330212  ORF g.330212 m.330212 type:complete len:513 (+) comp20457_c2_seq1:157-1695(+)
MTLAKIGKSNAGGLLSAAVPLFFCGFVRAQSIASSGPNISIQLSDIAGNVFVEYLSSDGSISLSKSPIVTQETLTEALAPVTDANNIVSGNLSSLSSNVTSMNSSQTRTLAYLQRQIDDAHDNVVYNRQNISALQQTIATNITDMLSLQTNASVQLSLQIEDAIESIVFNRQNITALQGSIGLNMQAISNLLIAVNGSQNTIRALQEDLNGVIDVLNVVANCTGGTCVPRVVNCSLTALPPPSNGHVRVLGDHGDWAPVGTIAEFSCQDGYYLSGTSTQSTCRSSGQWSASAPTCTACTAGCARCTGPTASGGCNACATGNVLGYTLEDGASFAVQNLDTDFVSLQMSGLSIAGSTNPTSIQTAKHLLAINPPASPGTWRICPGYAEDTCATNSWIQVDLRMLMYIGEVTVWHYFGDTRRYCNQRIAVSTTGEFAGEETTIYRVAGFSFVESATGNTVPAHGIQGRYIRHWSSRSNRNHGVHFMGIRVTAALNSTGATPTCTSLVATTVPPA